MNIISKKIEDLTPYENNPRHNEEAVEPVANSIKEFGFKVPIVIDADGVIVSGHTRYKAAKKLKMKEVPCIVADDLSPEQIKAFRIADNKTSELAGWDESLLGDELKLLENAFDFTDFGFGDFELLALQNDLTPDEYDEGLVGQYEKNATDYLSSRRIIITYKEDEEAELAKMLGLESVDKVMYNIGELR